MYNSRLLTNGEHDDLWRRGANAIIRSENILENIHRDLKRQTRFEIYKELYALGDCSKEEYIEALEVLLKGMN